MRFSSKNLLRKSVIGIITPLFFSFITQVQASEIKGAGATFVYPVLSKWSETYQAKTGNQLNYQPIGSGGGIAQIKAGAVTFGASDMPLNSEELSRAGLKQFPIVIGGVVPVVNIEGVAPGSLQLTGPILANIYMGKITQWNDPQIQKLNPQLNLPNQRISVIRRSDGSGTTFNWTNYLSKVSPTWKSQVGEGTSVAWPVGIGSKGNDGVARSIKQIKGSIGYADLTYSLKNNLSYTALQNKAGKFVQPDQKSFQAAATDTHWSPSTDFYNIMTDASGEQSWPITATTFIIMRKPNSKIEVDNSEALKFFKWSLENGQKDAQTLNYVPLPPSLIKSIQDYWSKTL